MKIFIDVGAHVGETLQEVVKPKYEFDKIYAIEPVKANCEKIKEKIDSDKVKVKPYGFYNDNVYFRVFNPGSEGATVFKNKKGVREDSEYINCEFRKASDWFEQYIEEKDEVYIKLNCEGSEVAIINDLLDSGEYDKIDAAFIDFDIRKVKGKEHLAKKTINRLLKLGHTNFITNYDAPRKGTRETIAGNRFKQLLNIKKGSQV